MLRSKRRALLQSRACRPAPFAMPSDRKIAANRQNSQRSTGPRTALAKKRTRHNALRHGLAAAILNAPGLRTETTRLAQAICGSHTGPAQREQAEIIAQCELLLLRVRAARVKTFEEISSKTPVQRSDEPPVLSHQQDATSCFDQLMRLERYERRLLSRRNYAIRAFSVLSQEL
jgi:hypothetical protein